MSDPDNSTVNEGLGLPLAPNADLPIDDWPKPFRLLARLSVGALALWLFISALAIMKIGAQALAPNIAGSTFADSIASTLGLGWLGAMLMMSGSPIAVSALALYDAGAVNIQEAFSMLTGSRLGASLIVLIVATVYALRGRRKSGVGRASISIGIYALILTAIVYIPALFVGLALLESDYLAALRFGPPMAVTDIVDILTGPILSLQEAWIPEIWSFPAGLLLLIGSVRILDLALPNPDEELLTDNKKWKSNKWIMFSLGSIIALVTMSVSVALTILVPLVAKGILKREHTIAYILGANVTTLGDTLLVAMLIGNQGAVAIVIVEIISISIFTLLWLTVGYNKLAASIRWLADWLMDKKIRAGLAIALLPLIPLSLILLVR